MQSITITNSGGGVAKTSTAVNLAATLSQNGDQVLIVDLDAQGSASDWLGHDVSDRQHLLLDVLLGELDTVDAIQTTYLDNLDLIPSSFHLYQAEKHLSDEVAADTLLKIALEQVEDSYDWVVLDTPPQIGILSYNAMLAAPSGLIIPCEASYKSLHAMKALMRVIKLMKTRRCSDINLLGILPSRVDLRTKSSIEAVDVLKDTFGEYVFDTLITESVVMKDAPSHHLSVVDYAPKSKTAKQIKQFTDEVKQRLSKRMTVNAAA